MTNSGCLLIYQVLINIKYIFIAVNDDVLSLWAMICRGTGYFKDGHDRKQYLLEYGQMFLLFLGGGGPWTYFPKNAG